MKINDELIDHLAHLSRLQFDGNEKAAIKSDLSNIINFMGKLNEVDTEGVEPLIFMNTEKLTLREDIPVDSVSQEEALKNAPKKDSDYFRIAKVLDKANKEA